MFIRSSTGCYTAKFDDFFESRIELHKLTDSEASAYMPVNVSEVTLEEREITLGYCSSSLADGVDMETDEALGLQMCMKKFEAKRMTISLDERKILWDQKDELVQALYSADNLVLMHKWVELITQLHSIDNNFMGKPDAYSISRLMSEGQALDYRFKNGIENWQKFVDLKHLLHGGLLGYDKVDERCMKHYLDESKR